MKTGLLKDKRGRVAGFIIAFAIVGTTLIIWAKAETPNVSFEAEDAQISGSAQIISDTAASNGKAIRLNGATTNATLPSTVTGGYALKWSDEFDGAAVDTNKWFVKDNSNYGSGNNEDQCFKAANVSVANGVLRLTAKKETVTCGGTNPDTGNKTYYWTSGMLTTQSDSSSPHKYEFNKGYAEARIKMPQGNPYWLGFWLVGGTGAPGWPAYGEIDITELVGARPDLTYGTFHYADSSGAHKQTSFSNILNEAKGVAGYNYPTNDMMTPSTWGGNNVLAGANNADFHTYGLLWESSKLVWYFDGNPFRSLENVSGVWKVYEYYGVNGANKVLAKDNLTPPGNDPLNFNHTIHITSSIGGAFPQSEGYTGQDASSGYSNGNLIGTYPNYVQFDYVRVWQK